ncbi:MAG: hypothetical protein V1685_06480 [Parcubacteria group bacterium]
MASTKSANKAKGPVKEQAGHQKVRDDMRHRQIQIGAMVLLALLLGYAVYDYFSNREQDQVRTTQVAPRKTFDTSDWVTYTNDAYGFTMKIPPEWEGYAVTRATVVTGEGENEWSYNYFHFEYPKKLVEDEDAPEVGSAFFEIGLFSPANWEKVKQNWILLGAAEDVIFAGKSSPKDLATGLGDRYEEIEGVFQTFEL